MNGSIFAPTTFAAAGDTLLRRAECLPHNCSGAPNSPPNPRV
jgi:hypothetical protein